MCVASYGYGRLVGSGIEVVDSMHAGQRQGSGRLLGDAGAFPECEVIH